MSSIAVAGDTSGSVTLSAPAVAGTTVLTLPTTNGTLVTTGTTSGISGSAITTGTVGTTVGGTGLNSFTSGGAVYASSTSALTTGTLPVASGGTGVTSATAYAVLTGGTTSTGAVQSVASVGTSGQVLTSQGAGALPTWTTISATPTTAQVLSAYAGASAGAVGTYGFFRLPAYAGANPGDTIAGSTIFWATVSGPSFSIYVGSNPSGTWMLLGYSPGAAQLNTMIALRIS